ncbi:hypothetical protein PV11_00023 [Exophiala sideris]|uniref:Uncharacterized protein n=1 Tax=Exophiala sideris TaxID=1016849 RepID=A0A0D1YMT9_9EURO|nr:hypothetical protein PV11_00023 [Exophiala sideris]
MALNNVGDLVIFLRQYNPEHPLKDVFTELAKLAKPDRRKKSDRARAAVDELVVRAAQDKVDGLGRAFRGLLAIWKDNPSRFFTNWSLESNGESNASYSTGSHNVSRAEASNTATFYEKISQMRESILTKREYCIRYVFHAIFFRDLLISGKRRDPDDKGLLPRGKGFNRACLKLCRRFLTPEASKGLAGDIAKWVKHGQKFHNIARTIECGALLLLTSEITQDKWVNNLPSEQSKLASVLEPLLKVIDVESKDNADSAAQDTELEATGRRRALDDHTTRRAKRPRLEETDKDAISPGFHDNQESPNVEASLVRPQPYTSHNNNGGFDLADTIGTFDDVTKLHHTALNRHENTDHHPERRCLAGVGPSAFDEQTSGRHSDLRLVQLQSGNSVDLNSFTANIITEAWSLRHRSNVHQESPPSDVNSNASHITPPTEVELQMNEAAVEVIKAIRPLRPNAVSDCEERRLKDHAGGRDERGPTVQEHMADEPRPIEHETSNTGPTVPGMAMDVEPEFESLNMPLPQNDNAGSSNVPADQFADNIMEASIDNTTLPAPANEVDFNPPLETNFTLSDLTMFMLPVQAGYSTTMGFDSSLLEHENTNFMDLFDQPSLVGFLDNAYTTTNDDDVVSTLFDS